MDETEENKDKTLWSYSRTTCFCNCKYEFYLNYIVNDDELYLPEGNYYAEVGTYVHEILAMIFDGKLKEKDALEYFMDHYDDYVFYKAKQSTMDKTYELVSDYFANIDLGWLKNYDILGVELKTNFKVGEYDFIGFIDLLLRDKRDGKIVVVDHKSSPYPFKKDGKLKYNSQESFESYKKQMYLYCRAIHQTFGEFPKEIVWNHFKERGKLARIPFSKTEYNLTMRWFKKTVQKIEQEKDFEPTQNFFYCNNLCKFRSVCEYLL